MVRIDLTVREAEILEGVLDSYLSDLRQEITHTERMDFRGQLKERETFLTVLIGRLSAERAAS